MWRTWSLYTVYRPAPVAHSYRLGLVTWGYQVRIPVGPDICHRGCAYTVFQTVQRHGVHSAAYGTVHYKEPLKSFEIRVGHSPGYELPSVAILPWLCRKRRKAIFIYSDYPPVQVTPGGNLKLVTPSSFKLPPQFYRIPFNDNNKLNFIFLSHGIGTFSRDILTSIGITLSSLRQLTKKYVKKRFNTLIAKLLNLNFHPLEVVSRWRDPQRQVSENYSDLTKWRSTLIKSLTYLKSGTKCANKKWKPEYMRLRRLKG